MLDIISCERKEYEKIRTFIKNYQLPINNSNIIQWVTGPRRYFTVNEIKQCLFFTDINIGDENIKKIIHKLIHSFYILSIYNIQENICSDYTNSEIINLFYDKFSTVYSFEKDYRFLTHLFYYSPMRIKDFEYKTHDEGFWMKINEHAQIIEYLNEGSQLNIQSHIIISMPKTALNENIIRSIIENLYIPGVYTYSLSRWIVETKPWLYTPMPTIYLERFLYVDLDNMSLIPKEEWYEIYKEHMEKNYLVTFPFMFKLCDMYPHLVNEFVEKTNEQYIIDENNTSPIVRYLIEKTHDGLHYLNKNHFRKTSLFYISFFKSITFSGDVILTKFNIFDDEEKEKFINYLVNEGKSRPLRNTNDEKILKMLKKATLLKGNFI